jgi:hypothetical protein
LLGQILSPLWMCSDHKQALCCGYPDRSEPACEVRADPLDVDNPRHGSLLVPIAAAQL